LPQFDGIGLVSWIFMGLAAGALARYLLPGPDRMGCLATILTGIVGALVGGTVSTLLGFGGYRGYDVHSLIVATLGAILFLIVLRLIRPARKR
jgi:uncharacterized membrane protein YeaQ/YmgE (transglycosylase-associated protein family)